MKLTKIETKTLKEIREQINVVLNESTSIEKMNEFYDEDIEYRIDEIDIMISLLNSEKELLNDLSNNNRHAMNDEIKLAADNLVSLIMKQENNGDDVVLRTAVLGYLSLI
jgi:uncharacterized protein YoxC